MTSPIADLDPYALPTNRGRPRELEPQIDPDSPRGMARWRARIDSGRRPLCVSLWSGAGGLDWGLEQAGYDVAVAVDHDQWACQSHGHNSHAAVFCRDLDDPDEVQRFLSSLELPEIALVAGGFPCQPYSRAGRSMIRHLVREERREAEDPRAFAWRSFVAAVDVLRPERALIENVPDIARFNDGRLLRDIVVSLEDLGYEVDIRVLAARAYGVPQYRERLFIQASSEESISWPEPLDEAESATVRSAIADLPPIPAGYAEDPAPYHHARYSQPPVWARETLQGQHADFVFDHIARAVREDDLEAFRQMKAGATYLDIPEELRRYDDEHFTDKYKRLEWDRPSRTITAHIARDGYWYIHPEQHRTLSIREAARLQTFPDSFRFAGHPSNRYTQIGNAVPPALGRVLGEVLLQPGRGAPSKTPATAALLKEFAAGQGAPKSPWEVLVAEVVFGGRAGPERVSKLLDDLPDPMSAIVSPADGERERRAKDLALKLIRDHENEIPTEVGDLEELGGLSAASARLVSSLLEGGEPPKVAATRRLAERVSGVDRSGSLSGIVEIVLARLASFGDDPKSNQVLVDLAREVCLAEQPRCEECALSAACEYFLMRDEEGSGLNPDAQAAAAAA